MNLFEKINKDKIEATKLYMKGETANIKEQAKIKKSVLTMVIAKANDIAKTKKLEQPTDEMITDAIKKEMKQLEQTKESCEKYDNQVMLKETMLKESILKEYLPKQLSKEELTIEITKILSEIDTSNKGLVMKTIMPKFKNKADGKLINSVITEILNNK